jgi:hypothetical protein
MCVTVDGYIGVLAPPLQEAQAGHVRAEGEAVGVTGQVCYAAVGCCMLSVRLLGERLRAVVKVIAAC